MLNASDLPDRRSEYDPLKSPSAIAEVVSSAYLTDICNPRTGDCSSVAAAIASVFPVEEYVWAVDKEGALLPAHAAVRVDGVLIDGFGRISEERLRSFSDMRRLETRDLDSNVPGEKEVAREVQGRLVSSILSRQS